MNSLVVYKVKCNGCSSTYVGQTSQHVTTIFLENQKKDSSVGQNLVECCGTAHNNEWKSLDAYHGVEKLMTIEAIYIKEAKPQLKTHDGYRGREVTLKYSFKCKKFDWNKIILVHVMSKFCQPNK